MALSHTGMTTEEFSDIVDQWIQTARHPEVESPIPKWCTSLCQELLDYLRDNDFITYIVSGGRLNSCAYLLKKVYGIPPEQTIGSSVKTRFEVREDGPVLVRLPEIEHVDDGEGKPVGINRFIGKQPILAFGNSDGDLEMLQWTAAGDGLRLIGIVHHTDSDREWAYDRGAPFGGLDEALDEATDRDWLLVDMANDWSTVYK
ncbi:MAG: HAD family hydrolase [Chloroflexota bacterium]